MMKKFLVFLIAAFAFLACENINVSPEGEDVDSRVVSFKFSLKKDYADTKAKMFFENGDKVYIFFEGVANKYVKLSYDGKDWTATASADLMMSDFAGKNGKLNAIHFPSFVGEITVSYGDDAFSFKDAAGNSIYTYYMSASDVDYSLSSTTLSATINVTKPDGFVQFFVPINRDGHGFRLLESHLQPRSCTSVSLDGTINIDASQPAGYVVKGYPASNDNGSGSKDGIMFSGYLSSAGTPTDYHFSLVTYISEEKPAALGTQVLSGSQTVNSGVILNLPNPSNGSAWTNMDYFVDLGDGGPLWATGNLDKTNNCIVGPLQSGEYFQWGATSSNGACYTGSENPLPTSQDAAYQANSQWRIPTTAQYAALIAGTSSKWVEHWTSIGTNGDGCLFTSKINGISLFFPAAGYRNSIYNNRMDAEGVEGDYWTSSFRNDDEAYNLYFSPTLVDVETTFLKGFGLPIRPIKIVAPAL